MNLICENISKRYGGKRVLKDFTYEMKPGVYGLLGPNGAGKTTLMNIMTDNLHASSGRLFYDGSDIHELGREYRRHIGYVPQQQQLFSGFTLRRFLLYISGLKGLSTDDSNEQIQDIVRKVNLENMLDVKLAAFSGGMKQRALLAQALIGNPSVIILDEPTAGLDPNERIRFRNIVSKISFNRIVIIATHVVQDIQFIANRVIILNDGSIVTEGAPWELCNEVRGKVFEIFTDEMEIPKIELKFKVGDMMKDKDCIRVRVVSDTVPEEYDYTETEPSLEDVYLYKV